MLNYLASLPGAVVQGLIYSLLGIGVYITYKILDLADLTVDGSFATGGIVAALLIVNGMHFIPAMLIAFLAGLLCGFVTGLLHTVFGIPPILAGILTQMILWSVNLAIGLGRSNIPLLGNNIETIFTNDFGIGEYAGLIKVGVIVIAVIALLYLFFGTELGASIRATGNNQIMSRAMGINTKRNVVIGLALSNGIVALSGALFAMYQGSGDVNHGKGVIVIGLCAVIIGVAIFSKIAKNFAVRLATVVVGGVIYYIVFQTIVYIGVDTMYLKMLAAIIVALFLGIPYLQKTYGAKIKKHFDDKKLLKGGDK